MHLFHFYSLVYFFSFIGWEETESIKYGGRVIDDECGAVGGIRTGRVNRTKYLKETCPSATLSTTYPTWLDLGSYPGRRGGKLETNLLSYGTALYTLHQTEQLP
jgi:hypothetical protein